MCGGHFALNGCGVCMCTGRGGGEKMGWGQYTLIKRGGDSIFDGEENDNFLFFPQ